MNVKKYKEDVKQEKMIRSLYDDWLEFSKKSSVDKQTFEIRLNEKEPFYCYYGYSGHSSVYKFQQIDQELFAKYLKEYLKKNLKNILEFTADRLAEDLSKKADTYRNYLEEELRTLEH